MSLTTPLSEVAFVNIHGEAVDTTKRVPLPAKARSTAGESAFHKGWVVEGLPPRSVEEAKALHEAKRRMEIQNKAKRITPEWSEADYLRLARGRRVRTKPYEILEAAYTCKALAEKAGWVRVTVRAVSGGAN
jgi:hypothetical protein